MLQGAREGGFYRRADLRVQSCFASRMATVAGNFNLIGAGILAELAAIFVAGTDFALAGLMGAFPSGLWHRWFLSCVIWSE